MSKNLIVGSRGTRPGVYHRICDRCRVGNRTSLLIARAPRRSHRGFTPWRPAPRSSPSPSEIRDSGFETRDLRLVTVLPLPCPPLGAETFASPNSGCTPAATGRRQRMFRNHGPVARLTRLSVHCSLFDGTPAQGRKAAPSSSAARNSRHEPHRGQPVPCDSPVSWSDLDGSWIRSRPGSTTQSQAVGLSRPRA